MQVIPSIAVHGGAGDRDPADIPAARAGCVHAAAAGLAILAEGGTALEAVEVSVRALEGDPAFNAGRGSVLNSAGAVEVDAAIMSGEGLRAGAVGAVPNLLHPVTLARHLLEDGRHVLLVGEGALAFARRHGIAPTPADELVTPRAVRRYSEALLHGAAVKTGSDAGDTVGAVACDARGHVAAATSTGGTSFKLPGRVGDTPLLGCGTYADDRLGAVSATGRGESIMRVLLARRALDLCAAGRAPDEAARAALAELAERTAGVAGAILVDPTGRIGVAFTTRSMPWAHGAVGETIADGA